MKVIYGIGKIKTIKRPVVALGVFDGVHLGHSMILRALVRFAKKIKGHSLVVTFSPHPQSQLDIYSLDHRLRLFKKIGVNICMVIRFTESFSKISALSFIEDFLVKKINPLYIFVGENFTFGRHRRGTVRMLKKYAQTFNFKLKVFPVYKLNRRPVSSTYIRQLIMEGRLREASSLLGRPVSILGRVIKGSSIARKLGFPTANIIAHHEIIPPSGVYLVRVNLGNRKFKGLCYIGSRPTLKFKPLQLHIEVHIFGLNKNLYGKDLEILFIKKIREEKSFANLKDLAIQIQKDIGLARKFLTHPNFSPLL